MSASDFHVYNCCLPKVLTTWGDCKEFMLGPPVAVDSASPLFEAPSINWKKKLFAHVCLTKKTSSHPCAIFVSLMVLLLVLEYMQGVPLFLKLLRTESWNQKLGVSTINTERISQVAATFSSTSIQDLLPVQSSSICWASTCCCFAKRAFSSSAAKLWNFDGSNAPPYQMKQFEGVTSSWKQENNKIYSTTYVLSMHVTYTNT